MTAAIQAVGVTKSFGDLRVLKGVDISIAAGEGVVLLGANGCGKSTFMRCLNRLERHDAGTITVDGVDVAGADARSLRALRRRVGYVFQQFNLVPNVSAFQNVMFGQMGAAGLIGSMGPFAKAEARERAMACLERVGLADRAHHRASQMSGGQQQRVAIARMLMQDPAIVIADEPIASLDPKAGREVLDLLWDVVREKGMTVLCTLHQLDLAREYGDRIIGMKAGRVEIDGESRGFDLASLTSLYYGPAERIPA